MSKGVKANPLWPQYTAALVLALAFIGGFLRYSLFDWSDPYHCRSLLTYGQWLDPKFQNWQPQGCMLHTYKPNDISTCLGTRRVVFIGDSVTRQLFFALAHASDASLPSTPPTNNEKHINHDLISKTGTRFSFYWNPYLNGTIPGIVFNNAAQRQDKPALLVIGSGLWYLRYAQKVGGMAAWEAKIEATFETIGKEMPALADEVVVLPVEVPATTKLSEDRAATIHEADIDAMNSELVHRIMSSSVSRSYNPFSRSAEPSLPISLPIVFNKMLDSTQTDDGLHFSSQIVTAEANVLLNLRCNNVLSNNFPFDKTCCRRYPRPPLIQMLVLVVVVLWGPLAGLLAPRLADYPQLAMFFPAEEYVMPLTTFGLSIGLSYAADRTGIWLKEQKQFDPWVFGSLCAFALLAGLLTVKRGDKDLGFMNRPQTDEWKGWMQLAILIYHYFGASKISGIYNPIRVLVAAYLFMTGYGHTTFYLKKADFGFLRIAQVLVRLNLLTIALAYAMNTDYLFYYFAPLVSIWFLIIYVTLFVGAKYNERTLFVIAKFLLSMAAVTFIMSQPWILEELFKFLDTFFHIKWSAKEWAFRFKLDLYIVYAGMFTALAYVKFRESRLADHPQWRMFYGASIVLSAIALLWFFIFELSQPTKFAYNAWHPFMSFLPVGAFAILRNATPVLRSATSRLFAFIGTCSLETFILQYHIWLAADTKGILLIIPGTRWRPLNMVLSTIVFIWISNEVSNATGKLTNWLCAVKKKSLPTTAAAAATAAPVATQEPEAIPLVTREGEPASETADDAQGQTEPSRPGWLDRLATTPAEPGFKLFKGDGAVLEFGAGARLTVALLVMWVVNVAWPQSPR